MSIRSSISAMLLIVLVSSAASAAEVIERIGVVPKPNVLTVSSRVAPLRLESSQEASQYFEPGVLAVLNQRVDFERQYVLVVAWRGGAGASLNYGVLGSVPPQVVFSYQPANSDNVASYYYVFALRKGVTYRPSF